MNQFEQIPWVGIVCLAVAAGLSIPTTAAYETDSPSSAQAAVDDTQDLIDLALLFSERPVALANPIDALEAGPCGQAGHCNYMQCGGNCGSGETEDCKCTPKDVICEDDHDWYNPFDNDQHNMYECNCVCLQEDPPSGGDCLIKVGNICVLEEAPGPGDIPDPGDPGDPPNPCTSSWDLPEGGNPCGGVGNPAEVDVPPQPSGPVG